MSWYDAEFRQERRAGLMKEREQHETMKEKALDIQVGGGHYKGMKIQPIEYCMANGFNACQSHAIKYISRTKGDKAKLIEDRRKAIHCIELEIGFLEGEKE